MHAMPIWSAAPFCLLLVCIAVLPLLPTAHWWESNLVKLSAALSLGILVAVPMLFTGWKLEVAEAAIEYGQYMMLLLALFVITGGIAVSGDLTATPKTNSLFLALGGALATVIGTTGAAILLLRVLLKTNQERTRRKHTVMFAIFIIANCGGLLLPMGDPPNYIGLLRGVPFTWPLTLWPEWLFVNGMLLLDYYLIERQMYAAEPVGALALDRAKVQPIKIHGKRHILLLAGVVTAVAVLPSVRLEQHYFLPIREVVMASLIMLSLTVAGQEGRRENGFTWHPIAEVGALFAGIFLTMAPALVVVARMAPSLPVSGVSLFASTGVLSSVLDNAPTYATFFEVARGASTASASLVAGVAPLYLAALTTGAVFCGAMTYIGNGPNFMVKSIAEHAGVDMPSFVGYTVKWAVPYLGTTLLTMAMIFFATDPAVHVVGLLLAPVSVGGLWLARRWGRRARRPATALAGQT